MRYMMAETKDIVGDGDGGARLDGGFGDGHGLFPQSELGNRRGNVRRSSGQILLEGSRPWIMNT